MKKKTKKLLLKLIPTIIAILCIIASLVIKYGFGYNIREIPRRIFITFIVICLGSSLLLLLKRIKRIAKYKNSNFVLALSNAISILLIAVIAAGTIIAFISSAFFDVREKEVEKYGIKMIEIPSIYPPNINYYYQYISSLFYGKRLGYEEYEIIDGEKTSKAWMFLDGNGNMLDEGKYDDSLNVDLEKEEYLKKEINESTINLSIKENRASEFVFEFTTDEFIDCYNWQYWKENNRRFLLPISKWSVEKLDTGIHNESSAYLYTYTDDDTIWSLPKMSLYTPDDCENVEEIALIYDWHSYGESTYYLYEKMCYYTLKGIFTDYSDQQITDLYKKINKTGYENCFPIEMKYAKDAIPFALFYKGNIGIYSYFSSGSYQRLCIIPVNDKIINDFKEDGVEINTIE